MSTTQDITKLTVSQLKCLCKDKGISGYSKLNKASLIQKLDLVVSTASSKITKSSNEDGSSDEVLSSSGTFTSAQGSSTAIDRITRPTPCGSTHVQNDTLQRTTPQRTCPASTTPPAPVIPGSSVSGEKRPALSSTEKAAKKPRRSVLASVSSLAPEENGSAIDLPCIHSPSSSENIDQSTNLFLVPAFVISKNPRPHLPTAHSRQAIPAFVPTRESLLQAGQSLFKIPELPQKAVPSKSTIPAITNTHYFGTNRFKPLVITARPAKSSEFPSLHAIPATSSTTDASQVPLRYLEFSPSPEVSLTSITLPPSISQRKRLQQWALALSELSNAERRQCVYVSRMFRYAVYLSATTKLWNEFNGKRLDQVMQMYPQNMTNMWPYLRVRQDEVALRRMSYRNSFIAYYYKDFEPVSCRLWTSPDNPKQYEVAIRFVMTKLWFAMSVGSGVDDSAWPYGVVVDAQEVVKGEIWSITVSCLRESNGSRREVFYVLEPTCEVVGHPPASPLGIASSDRMPLRADWSAYIEQHTSSHLDGPANTNVQPLLSRVRWANYEEYDRGMSRLWLRRVLQEGRIGVSKQQVASRYILACVVGNSVSGSWMSVNEMARQDTNLSARAMPMDLTKRTPRVNMFLSTHHHIESLHFTTSNGKPLHPALAVVQTMGREYYILKDNGMQVGCEEEGVVPIWMELLKCDHRGCLVVSR